MTPARTPDSLSRCYTLSTDRRSSIVLAPTNQRHLGISYDDARPGDIPCRLWNSENRNIKACFGFADISCMGPKRRAPGRQLLQRAFMRLNSEELRDTRTPLCGATTLAEHVSEQIGGEFGEEDRHRTARSRSRKAELAMICGALTAVVASLAFVAISSMELSSAARGYTQG